jgi:hypothetical protein
MCFWANTPQHSLTTTLKMKDEVTIGACAVEEQGYAGLLSSG